MCRVIGGEMSRDDVRSLLLAHAVMVAPSRTEGCGLVFYEAIQCGLPIVTLDAPPMREYVPPGTGWLLPCRPTSRRGLAIEYDVDPLHLANFLSGLSINEILEKRANLLRWRKAKLDADTLSWADHWREVVREKPLDTPETPGYSLSHSALPPSGSVRGETHAEEDHGGGDAAS
jgi:glycosyltransferase involved in cell wall biosynthesis